MAKIRLALALHNHQPVGNFDGVIEAAYWDSYLPFLDVIERYPEIPFALHTSGCLLEWLVERKPDYVQRLRRLVDRGQLEIVGGAFYEPILPMIPARDRVGQIRGYTEYLSDLFSCQVRGMWVAERVWEQALVSNIAKAGIEYTILDDYHFRKAGVAADQLHGYYLSEDEGAMLRIFPGSEPMRYMIPFQEVDNTLRYLGELSSQRQNAVVVFADDGEKFGAWPDTKAHVYERGWIYRFLDALRASRDWIEVCTPAQALDALDPIGQVYLSDCSYREMTEWALPPERLVEYERIWHDLDHNHEGWKIKEFMKGGFWRNFKVKYPETNEMYARMLQISDRLEKLCHDDRDAFGDQRVHQARTELFRGQCNCPYWHGAFGGLYLPHLRNAIYTHLIHADNRLVEYEKGPEATFVGVEAKDFNFDGYPDVRLENDKLVAFFDPAKGGHLYELDVRGAAINVGASLSRRPEAYHEKVRRAGSFENNNFGSIHDRVVFKQEGLDRRLQYDAYPRKSLVDHFLADDANPGALQAGEATEVGDFVTGRYETTIYRSDDQATVTLSREGSVGGHPVRLTKTIRLASGQHDLRIHYRLENLPKGRRIRFAVEFNFAALATGADDRYFYITPQNKLGRLEAQLELHNAEMIGLVDEWLGVDIAVGFSHRGGVWTFPVQSVSQSEGGFELVHQSVCVVPHWDFVPVGTVWEVEMFLALDASLAEARRLAPV